jgi:hypothetical protein
MEMENGLPQNVSIRRLRPADADADADTDANANANAGPDPGGGPWDPTFGAAVL